MIEKTLVVVGHTDDEALWCGGYLAANPGTHVACCSIDTRKPERVVHFYQSCEILGAVPFIVAGAFEMWSIDTRPIQAFARDYDSIITHNAVGEYGHPAHIQVHEAMKILGKPMRVFGYGVSIGGELVDYERKRKAIECYTTENLTSLWQQFDLTRESLLSCY